MKLPAYGPLETLITGAEGPNPLIPSCTIVPAAMATSTTFEPHALRTVPMSIPWSRVQSLDGRTRLSGSSGNTRELVAVEAGIEFSAPAPPLVSSRALPRAACLTAASSAWAVRGPTEPLTGRRLWVAWKFHTAPLVMEPKYPVAGTP